MFSNRRILKLSTVVTMLMFVVALFVPNVFMAKATATQTIEVVTIAKGTSYATPAYIIKSDKPGPTVAVIGGVHGDEKAGYTAARQVKDYKISKGTLIVIPEANAFAVKEGRRAPSATGDLNRLFPQNGSSPDGPIATAIVNFFKNYDVDWAMDLHEGFDFYKNPNTNSVGQTIIYYPRGNSQSFSESLVKILNKDIAKSSEQFTVLRGPVGGSLARYLGDQGAQSFIFETCSKQTLSVRVDQQLTAVNTMLKHLSMLATGEQTTSAPEVKPEPAPAPVPAPEVKPEPTPVPVPAPEVKPEPTPAPVPAPVVKPEPTPAPVPAPVVKPEPAPIPEVIETNKTGSNLANKTISFGDLLRGLSGRLNSGSQPTVADPVVEAPVAIPVAKPVVEISAPTPAQEQQPNNSDSEENQEQIPRKRTFTLNQLVSLIIR